MMKVNKVASLILLLMPVRETQRLAQPLFASSTRFHVLQTRGLHPCVHPASVVTMVTAVN